MRRILILSGGSRIGGAEIATLESIRGLTTRGHDVRGVVSGWHDGDVVARLRAMGVPCEPVKLGYLFLSQPRWTLDSAWHYPGAIRALRHIRRTFAPAIVAHAGYRTLVVAPWLFPRERTFVHVHERESDSARTRRIYRLVARRAARIIATSQFIARDLVAKGVPAEQVAVVYPAVHVDTPQPARPSSGHVLRIGIVGRIVPDKGHADLLEAVRRLRAGGCAVELHVFGRGSDAHSAELVALAARLDVAKTVRFHGFVVDRSAIYRALDLVVVPSRGDSEAFGLAAAEPALFGLPVVAADGGGLPEIVSDGVTGLLFRRDDVADLTTKLEALVRDADLRARLGAAGRDRVTRLFSSDVTARALERVYGCGPAGKGSGCAA